MTTQTRFTLSESDLPPSTITSPQILPVTPYSGIKSSHPGTGNPDFLSVLFPMNIIQQEISTGTVH